MKLHDTSNSVYINVRFNGSWERLREENTAKMLGPDYFRLRFVIIMPYFTYFPVYKAIDYMRLIITLFWLAKTILFNSL